MKKLIALLIVFVAFAKANASEIEPKTPLGVSVIKHGAIVKLYYRGEQSGTVKVTIYNDKGAVVYKETHQHTENFMRPFNFSSLPFGQYTIELSDDQSTRTETIKHYSLEEVRVAHLTRLNDRGNKYVLAVPNSGKDEIDIRIYNAESKLLYHEKQKVEGNFAKVYNLSGTQGEEHIFEIKDSKGKVNRLSKPLR